MTIYTSHTVIDDVYDSSITSVDHCHPDGGSYNLATPAKDYDCKDIFGDAWNHCANKGRGGAITAGCLVYKVATKY